jgi:hypothetical protein
MMTIELQIGLNAINSYRRLAYSPWHALAEFVDNSTQSFFNNGAILRKISAPGQRPLTVNIDYEHELGMIRVEDNAMGMSYNELQLAMQVATLPTNPSGRSKYGMGLKTAATWLGNTWSIKTKKLGENTEYTVTVNVNDVANGYNQLTLETVENVDLEQHYTLITITDLNRRFHTRTISKIGDYLSSMYREDFRNDVMTLIWQGKTLTWRELDDDLLRARDGSRYKKEFNFNIEGEDGEAKNVHGWVGVLEEGSRSKAGFSVLHSGRVIRGWPDAWRPETLYGQLQGSNDLINQRLVGEIHLDNFDVSHTKDDILWLGDEEDRVQEKLRQHSGDYREVARTYRKSTDEQRGPSEVAIRAAISNLKKELTSPEMANLAGADPLLPETLVKEVVASVTSSIVGKIPETFFATITENLIVKGYIDEMSVNDPYLTIDRTHPNEIIIIVNASHPHWKQLNGASGVLNYLRHCTYDGIAESQAQDKRSDSVKINPDTVKLLKDRLLRIPFEIEQQDAEFGTEETSDE